MKFWNVLIILRIIFLLFFAIGLPLILHYAGNHHQSDYQMIHTSANEAFILLGLGTALWFIVFIYYIKEFLINLLLKKNDTIQLLECGEKRKGTASYEFEFMDSKPYQRHFEVGNTIGIDGQVGNTKTIVLTAIGLLLLIALAAGILVYTYINESRGYGWRYLYFWHPYIMIPGSFILYLGFLFGTANDVFSKYLDKFVKP
ncbi:hypothetical protein [Pedobacter steynii]|uniref:Uncharacterized protein n=1 Tax=Pedobacter steynii TaxID=430522 RepID=A0A1D7QIA5_9SPHI|nr:hypothetical protein [Pedobacter steynii]AOM78373.1 hypothetical protein BFS30_15020 [Pedobacter steynii]